LLQLLTASERAAVVLFAEGWRYTEIADFLKKPLGTVSILIHRARQKMLRADEPGGKSSSVRSPSAAKAAKGRTQHA
jgi:DNA-directed RNA polymerase specialized sigma24 family protein